MSDRRDSFVLRLVGKAGSSPSLKSCISILLTLLIFGVKNTSSPSCFDNLTVSPSGQVVICEDGGDGNFVRCLGVDGVLTNLVLNKTDRPNDEFAGVCFSQDGRTMFVNIQAAEGLTFIIWRDDDPLL